MSERTLVERVRRAFAVDARSTPPLSLRGGSAIDEYREPAPFDPALDVVSDIYLEQHHWGVTYLDAASWRHYLPALIDYALRHLDTTSPVVEAWLWSLMPPDRQPPRMGTLSPEQKAVVEEVVWLLVTDSRGHEDLACRVLDEWRRAGFTG